MAKIVKKQVRDFNASHKCFHILTTVFGVTIVQVLKGSKSLCFLIELVQYASWMGCFGLLIYFNITKNYYEHKSNSILAKGSKRIFQLYGPMYLVTTMVYVQLVRGRVRKFINRINSIDMRMERLGYTKLNLWHEYIFCVKYIAGTGLFTCALFWISYTYTDRCDTLEMCFSVNNYVVSVNFSLFISHYILYTLSVLRRIKMINDQLQNLFIGHKKLSGNFKQKFQYLDFKQDNYCEKIKHLAKLHESLNQCTDDLNSCFSLQVLATLAGVFLFVVFTFFTIFRTYVAKDYDLSELAFSYILWSIYYSAPLIFIIVGGSRLTYHGKKTAVIIHRIINDISDVQIRTELSLFSQQLVHRYPVLTCQLFTFDWTLFYAIVNAITTYLVIIVQFDTSLCK